MQRPTRDVPLCCSHFISQPPPPLPPKSSEMQQKLTENTLWAEGGATQAGAGSVGQSDRRGSQTFLSAFCPPRLAFARPSLSLLFHLALPFSSALRFPDR